MAETSFSRLDHRAPLPQATVNRTGSGWGDVAGRVDRSDTTTYLPLSDRWCHASTAAGRTGATAAN